MATKTNPMMDDAIRGRRKEMMNADLYKPPSSETAAEDSTEAPKDETTEATYQVLAPGEPDGEDKFNYEPFVDMPGSWVVYPPGVACDTSEYRIALDAPADVKDFDGMQKALDDASGKKTDPGPMADTSVVSELDSEGRN